MLKLMKYEFIHSMRTFFVAFVIFWAGCILLPFVTNSFIVNIPVIAIVFAVGFSFLTIGIIIALFVSIVVNYNRSMFKKPGYLTLTLPVSTTELILSKLLTTIIWLVIASVVMMIGIFMIVFIEGIRQNLFTFDAFVEPIVSFFQNCIRAVVRYPFETLYGIIIFFSQLFIFVAGIFFSITIAHTKWFRKYQLFFGMIIYIMINFIIEWLGIVLFGSSSFMSLSMETQFMSLSIETYSILFNLYYIFIGLLFIFGTIYIINHHIEIE